MKWKISFILFFFLLLGVFLWIDRLQEGFSVQEIQIYSPPQTSQSLTNDLQISLNQEFRYLGKGCQFYVFESQDGRFVLKFFKQKHLRPFLGQSPRREAKAKTLCQSCQVAAEELAQETGVVSVHLARTECPLPVRLVDKLGLVHCVDLSHTQYVVQKKAENAPAVFARFLNEKRGAELQEKVRQLIELTESRCLAQVADGDKAFVQNVGFLEDRALLVDIGQLHHEPALSNPLERQQEVKRRFEALVFWATEHEPRLLPFLKDYNNFNCSK